MGEFLKYKDIDVIRVCYTGDYVGFAMAEFPRVFLPDMRELLKSNIIMYVFKKREDKDYGKEKS